MAIVPSIVRAPCKAATPIPIHLSAPLIAPDPASLPIKTFANSTSKFPPAFTPIQTFSAPVVIKTPAPFPIAILPSPVVKALKA